MINKMEIDLIIGVLNSVIAMIETLFPDSADSTVLLEIKSVIKTLQELGV